MSPNKQFVKIAGTRGETQEEECWGKFNVNPGDDVTCTLKSKLYVGTVACVEWRIDGYDGLGLSQVCKFRRFISHTVLSLIPYVQHSFQYQLCILIVHNAQSITHTLYHVH